MDTYDMNNKEDVCMLMTSSNAVKFEAKDNHERQTVIVIVDSLRIINV